MGRAKKIRKSIEGSILTIIVGEDVMTFNADTLADNIKSHLVMHGLSQKSGDSAAGSKEGEEVVKCIKATWETLVKGEWNSRRPASEKITKKDILEKFAGLSEERANSVPLLRKLGLI